LQRYAKAISAFVASLVVMFLTDRGLIGLFNEDFALRLEEFVFALLVSLAVYLPRNRPPA
jgi:hypothetical protein